MTNYWYGFLFGFFILSINTANACESNLFPFAPRLTIAGGSGNQNSQTYIDAMIPVLGNANGDIYTDISSQYGSDKTGFRSVGLGARQMINNQTLIGAYGFVDRDKTIDNQWLIFNPGIEMMTHHWDARINAYLPIGSDQHFQGLYFGDQIGQTEHEFFKYHQQYDGLYNKENVIGTGVDTDIGYIFPNFKKWHIHGGGYYFKMPGSAQNIRGEEAGLDIPIDQYFTLSVEDSNDNVYHNTTMLELKLNIGNKNNKFNQLLAPIRRHFGVLYNSSGIPQSSSFLYTGRDNILEKNNIWFFSPSGEDFNSAHQLNNCTYEHPCNGSSFSQDNIDHINLIDPGTNFYFAPGSYNLNGRLSLNNGQSIYGRTEDYKLAASVKTGLPVFVGGLNLDAGNNRLDSFELLNQSGDQYKGITINGADNILINNVVIGKLNDMTGFLYPLVVANAHYITLENSILNESEMGGFGIDSENVHDFKIDHNIINTNGGSGIDFIESNTGVDIDYNTFNINKSETGISIEPDSEENVFSDITIRHNVFNMNYSNGSLFGIADYAGNSMVNLDNNIFNLNSRFLGVGIIMGGSGEGEILNASHNIFNIDVRGDSDSEVQGIDMHAGTANLENNALNLYSTGLASGITINSRGASAVVNIKNNIFNFDALVIQHEENNGGIINDLGGNQWNNRIVNQD